MSFLANHTENLFHAKYSTSFRLGRTADENKQLAFTDRVHLETIFLLEII